MSSLTDIFGSANVAAELRINETSAPISDPANGGAESTVVGDGFEQGARGGPSIGQREPATPAGPDRAVNQSATNVFEAANIAVGDRAASATSTSAAGCSVCGSTTGCNCAQLQQDRITDSDNLVQPPENKSSAGSGPAHAANRSASGVFETATMTVGDRATHATTASAKGCSVCGSTTGCSCAQLQQDRVTDSDALIDHGGGVEGFAQAGAAPQHTFSGTHRKTPEAEDTVRSAGPKTAAFNDEGEHSTWISAETSYVNQGTELKPVEPGANRTATDVSAAAKNGAPFLAEGARENRSAGSYPLTTSVERTTTLSGPDSNRSVATIEGRTRQDAGASQDGGSSNEARTISSESRAVPGSEGVRASEIGNSDSRTVVGENTAVLTDSPGGDVRKAESRDVVSKVAMTDGQRASSANDIDASDASARIKLSAVDKAPAAVQDKDGSQSPMWREIRGVEGKTASSVRDVDGPSAKEHGSKATEHQSMLEEMSAKESQAARANADSKSGESHVRTGVGSRSEESRVDPGEKHADTSAARADMGPAAATFATATAAASSSSSVQAAERFPRASSSGMAYAAVAGSVGGEAAHNGVPNSFGQSVESGLRALGLSERSVEVAARDIQSLVGRQTGSDGQRLNSEAVADLCSAIESSGVLTSRLGVLGLMHMLASGESLSGLNPKALNRLAERVGRALERHDSELSSRMNEFGWLGLLAGRQARSGSLPNSTVEQLSQGLIAELQETLEQELEDALDAESDSNADQGDGRDPRGEREDAETEAEEDRPWLYRTRMQRAAGYRV